jgi:hypothetical protein
MTELFSLNDDEPLKKLDTSVQLSTTTLKGRLIFL